MISLLKRPLTMRLFRSISLNPSSESACLAMAKHFFSSSGSSVKQQTLRRKMNAYNASLYRRLSPISDPNVSMVPVLNQWIAEGKTVQKEELQRIIKTLRRFGRFKHALEVSNWMTDVRYFPLSSADVGLRVRLIYKLHGLEQLEKLIDNTPQKLKHYNVQISILNCYCEERLVEKAEALFQKLRDMGAVTSCLCYNIMMTLYYRIGDYGKLDNLMKDMESHGISYDKVALTIRLTAYTAVSDTEGMDKIFMIINSDARMNTDFETYATVANCYLKVGQLDRVCDILKKLEGLMTTTTSRNDVFVLVIKLYGEAGEKDGLYRFWNLYKLKRKIFNKGYMMMMRSLVKFDDIEGAEKIFEEWESEGLSYDCRIPYILINAYSRHGHLEKAEALLSRGISRGGIPSVDKWYSLAGGYIENNQIPKAVKALEKAISICPPNSRPSKDTMMTCVEYMERKANIDKAEEFIQSLKVEGIFSAVAHDRLLSFIKDGR